MNIPLPASPYESALDIENCASCRCGVDCTDGNQHYCNRCQRSLCEKQACCHMTIDDCSLIPADEVWCTSCMIRTVLASAQLMRDVTAQGVRVA